MTGKKYGNIKPYKIQKLKIQVEKSCNNCMDSIVCYGLEEPEDANKAKNCPDWALDIATYQDLIEEQEKQP